MAKKKPVHKKLSNLKQKIHKKHYLAIAIVLIAVGAFATSFFIKGQANSQTTNNVPHTAVISISPATGKVSARSTFRIGIWEDSQSQPVNAVQANVTYDTRKLSLVKIDSSSSYFDIAAQSTASKGVIYIARGRIISLNGRKLIAYLTFKPRVKSGTTSIKFAAGTVVSSASENVDILKSKVGGTYTLVR